MAAKLRPRVMLPRTVSSTAERVARPAAVSFSGLLGSALQRNDDTLLPRCFDDVSADLVDDALCLRFRKSALERDLETGILARERDLDA